MSSLSVATVILLSFQKLIYRAWITLFMILPPADSPYLAEAWDEANKFRVGNLIIQKNFGLIMVHWSKKELKVTLQFVAKRIRFSRRKLLLIQDNRRIPPLVFLTFTKNPSSFVLILFHEFTKQISPLSGHYLGHCQIWWVQGYLPHWVIRLDRCPRVCHPESVALGGVSGCVGHLPMLNSGEALKNRR